MNIVIKNKMYDFSEEELEYLEHFLFPINTAHLGIPINNRVIVEGVVIGYLSEKMTQAVLEELRKTADQNKEVILLREHYDEPEIYYGEG